MSKAEPSTHFRMALQSVDNEPDGRVKITVNQTTYTVRIEWKCGGDHITRVVNQYDFIRLMRSVVTEK